MESHIIFHNYTICVASGNDEMEVFMIITKYLLIYPLKPDNNLIINTLSGAVDVVDDITKSQLELGVSPQNLNVLEKLKSRFYIFENEEEEKKYFSNLSEYKGLIDEMENYKANFTLCPTYGCNLRCIYCFESNDMHETENIISHEQIDAAFTLMEKYVSKHIELKDYGIQLFGGEPLQIKTKDAVEYILGTALKKNKHVYIVTNGLEIEYFKEIFEKFKQIISFQITLDGVAEVHDKRRILHGGGGTFNKIVENIDYLIKKDYIVNTRVNLDGKTVKELPKLLDFFETVGWINYSNFQCNLAPVTNHNCIPNRQTSSEFEILEQLLKHFPDIKQLQEKYHARIGPDMFRNIYHLSRICNPSLISRRSNMPSLWYCEAKQSKTLGMGPDNFIYVCNETLGNKKYAVGKFFPKIKIDEEKILRWRKRTIFDISECSVCNISTLCGGGCPLAAYQLNGRPDTPFCGQTKENISKYINIHKQSFLEAVEG